jgi:hypothetical protein
MVSQTVAAIEDSEKVLPKLFPEVPSYAASWMKREIKENDRGTWNHK